MQRSSTGKSEISAWGGNSRITPTTRKKKEEKSVAKDGKAPQGSTYQWKTKGKTSNRMLGTEKSLSAGSEDQLAEWHAMVIRHLPRDLSTEERQKFIGNPSLLREVLRNALEQAVGKNIFPVTLRGKKTSALVAFAEYDHANPLITDELFPIVKHTPTPGTIELVEFDHGPSTEEVFAEFAKRGLERPAYEHALNFGIDYPEEQRKHPIVFLHEPVLDPHGHHSVFVLGGSSGERNLHLYQSGSKWFSHYVFAGVRKSAHR